MLKRCRMLAGFVKPRETPCRYDCACSIPNSQDGWNFEEHRGSGRCSYSAITGARGRPPLSTGSRNTCGSWHWPSASTAWSKMRVISGSLRSLTTIRGAASGQRLIVRDMTFIIAERRGSVVRSCGHRQQHRALSRGAAYCVLPTMIGLLVK